MPFIPHTDEDIKRMLERIGVDSIDALFDEIPRELISSRLDEIPAQKSEMAVARLMREHARKDGTPMCFAGAGAYEHHIPAAVWQITTRGEYYTAYTPYQAEVSQGTLQVIYEFQSMMAHLTGLQVSNASLYDGASALAEAVLMAVRANRKSKSKTVLMPRTVHPVYRRVVHNIVKNQGIHLLEVGFDAASGVTDLDALNQHRGEDITALVIPQPNYFGLLEPVNELTDWARANGALAIGVVNPTSLALLQAPGAWGESGVDICIGEGQPLGVPLSSGGPYFGFMTCANDFVRQIPGRIVGRTTDADGQPGFTLTFQAREQHIRRAKATSNICTNQGLMVTAATIYMALLGDVGLRNVATACINGAAALKDALREVDGIALKFDGPGFHEFVVQTQKPAGEVIAAMADHGIVAGVDVSADYPELGHALLLCVTETKTQDDLAHFVHTLKSVL